MKRSVYFSITTLIVFGGLFGCGADRPLPKSELPGFTDKIVINASLDNLTPIEVEISHAAGAYTNNLPEEYKTVDISLTHPGSSIKIPLIYNSLTNSFIATKTAEPGRSYELSVVDTTGRLQSVSARCIMPEAVLSKKIGFIENGGKDMDGLPSDVLSVQWIDVAGINYYIVHFYYYSQTVDLFIPFDFAMTDPTLSAPETVKLIDGGYLFSDALFNGREKKMTVIPPGGLVANNTDIRYLIELRSVTEDYYKYHTTLQRYRDTDDLQQAGPFGSAVIVHNNIVNGLGTFISSTLESDTIR